MTDRPTTYSAGDQGQGLDLDLAGDGDLDRDALTSWLRSAAHPLASVDPRASLGDLGPLEAMLGDADVVGLGESVRGARSGHELYRLKHRVLRLAVERLGFRSMTLEESAETGMAMDEYVLTGDGDPQALLASSAWGPWQTEEFLDVLLWMRAFNVEHPDDVLRVVGIDTGGTHVLARNTLAWLDHSGDRIVYWGGLAHTALGKANVNSFPPLQESSTTGPSDGSVLRDELGDRYVSVGVTCHHGLELPPPPAHFAESVLGAVGLERYLLDLHAPVPDEVRRWLTAPATTRVIGPLFEPDDNDAYNMSGGSLADWFDVIAHVQEITPVHRLADAVTKLRPY